MANTDPVLSTSPTEALLPERIASLPPERRLIYRRADGYTVIYTQACDCSVCRIVLDQYGQPFGSSYIL